MTDKSGSFSSNIPKTSGIVGGMVLFGNQLTNRVANTAFSLAEGIRSQTFAVTTASLNLVEQNTQRIFQTLGQINTELAQLSSSTLADAQGVTNNILTTWQTVSEQSSQLAVDTIQGTFGQVKKSA